MNAFGRAPIYDPEAIRPMWEELAFVGIRPLRTPDEVDDMLARAGIVLVVVNSVCGCAAGGARPGVARALQHAVIPDRLATVFAGVDRDAVDRVRAYMPAIPPSSPCIALFQDRRPIYVLERRHIEMLGADGVDRALCDVFDKRCTARGPSVSPETFALYEPYRRCGSTIPRVA